MNPSHGRRRPKDRCTAAGERPPLVQGHRQARAPVGAGGQAAGGPARARRGDPRLHGDRSTRPRSGWHTEAFVDLYCDGRMPGEAIRRAVEKEPGVVSAHTVAGEASAMLHVMAEDTRDLELALERIREGRGRRPHRHRGRALHAGAAMRRAYPDGQPPSIRDFLTFEEHLRNARGQAGLEVPEAWYEQPGLLLLEPGRGVPRRRRDPQAGDTAMLDYELELAAVIGAERRHRGLHDHERLVRARPPAEGDARGPRARRRRRTSPPRSAPSSCRPTSCPPTSTCAPSHA